MFMFCRNIENFEICYCASVTQVSDTKKSLIMKKEGRKKKVVEAEAKAIHLGISDESMPWERIFVRPLGSTIYWNIENKWPWESTGSYLYTVPGGWAHFIQPIHFIEKNYRKLMQSFVLWKKANLNNTQFSWKNWRSQRKVMSFFRITSTNAFKPAARSKKWTMKTHSCCSKPVFKLRKLQQKTERSLKRNRLICSFLEWILKFFEINGITDREIYIYLWRLYLL